MATTEDDIKIDLDALDEAAGKVPEKPSKAEKPAPKSEETDEPVITPDDGIAKLQKQLDGERAARESAERDAAELRKAEVRARADKQTSQLAMITTAIDNFKSSNANLKSEYAQALAAQDFEKVAEIQLAMSDNSARLIQLEAGKKQLENQPKPAEIPPTDIVEQFVSTMTPQSASWVRSHPEYVRDNKLNRRMIRAHEDAIDEGIKADTPEYFASIEKTLGITKDPIRTIPEEKLDDPTTDAAKPTSGRKAAPAAAPVTRSGNGAGNRSNVVTLTPDEVEMARNTGQTPEEYAKNKLALKKEGRLN